MIDDLNRIFLFLFILSLTIYAQPGDTLFVHSDSLHNKDILLSYNNVWHYKSGDNLKWAGTDFDHSDWDTLSPWMDLEKFDIDRWTGIGWFRKVIKIDSSLINKTIGIIVHHEGASEIYLNGLKIKSFGTIGASLEEENNHDPIYFPCVLNFNSNTIYTIAVRYSNQYALANEFTYRKFFGHIGFSFRLFNYKHKFEEIISDWYTQFSMSWVALGFYASFSLIFFLLYFFYSKRSENLYFALFTFGLFTTGLSYSLEYAFRGSLQIITLFRFIEFLGFSFVVVNLLLFIYNIVYKKVIRPFWFFVSIFVVVNTVSFFASEHVFSNTVPFIIIIPILIVESIRVIFVGFRKKTTYIGIIAFGVFIFILSALLTILFQTLLISYSNSNILDILFIITLASIPISMAVYLARSFEKTNSDLEKQIIQVKELSAKQIEQEKKNTELRIQSEREKAENYRKTKELEKARHLQLSMLPKELPKTKNLDIAAYMKTASEVGGDYYDFIYSESGALNVVIGDATGHGIDAGMMVSVTKGLIQSLASCNCLQEMLMQFNQLLYDMKLQPMYMTLNILRIEDYTLHAVGAGMYPFIIFDSKNDTIREVESSGPPVGVFPKNNYSVTKIALNKGDIIVLMTDGFTERLNINNEQLGDEKAKSILLDMTGESSNNIIEQLIKECDEWGAQVPQDDDITFVVIRVI